MPSLRGRGRRPLSRQAFQDILDRELARRFQGAEFFPFQRQCYGRTGTGPDRVICDRGRCVVVAEIVDEDLALALGLGHRRDISFWRGLHHFVRDHSGEGFHLRPFFLARQRHRHMQALSACALEHGFKPFALQPPAKILRGPLDRFKRDVRSRVEIEDQAVGTVYCIDARTPWMYFDRAHLDEFQQAFFILDVEILVTLAFVL